MFIKLNRHVYTCIFTYAQKYIVKFCKYIVKEEKTYQHEKKMSFIQASCRTGARVTESINLELNSQFVNSSTSANKKQHQQQQI